jgi:hypothetical protein
MVWTLNLFHLSLQLMFQILFTLITVSRLHLTWLKKKGRFSCKVFLKTVRLNENWNGSKAYTVSGQGGAVDIATRLQAGRFGVRIPVKAILSAPLRTRPGAHLASCTMGNEVLSRRYSDRSVVLTTHHPVLKLRMSEAIPLLHTPAEPSWVIIRGMEGTHT